MSNEALQDMFLKAWEPVAEEYLQKLMGKHIVTGEWFGKTKPWDPVPAYQKNKLRLTWSPQDDGGILYRWDLGEDIAMVHLVKGWILDLMNTKNPSVIDTQQMAIDALTGETLTTFIEGGRYLTADQELRIYSTWHGIVASLSDGHIPTQSGSKSL